MNREKQTFTARPGCDGEVLVVSPGGRVQFFSLWGFMKFVWQALRAGHEVSVEE